MNGKSLWLCMSALAFLWLGPAHTRAVHAEEPPAPASAGESIDELRHEIILLKQTVLGLEHRVSEIERCNPDPCASPEQTVKIPADRTAPGKNPAIEEPAPPPSAAAAGTPILQDDGGGSPSLRQRWRSIERRMSAGQIESLLGRPQQKFSVAGKTVWYYRYPDNRRGSVTFSGDMRVSGWQRPSFGGF